jgi:hypothetical protein
MATYDWQVFIETSNYGWSAEVSFPRPNEQVETKLISTQTVIKLADGSNAFVRPEVKRTKEAFTLIFISTTSALRSQIEGYLLNGDKLKIITHTGETFIGRIVDMSRVWLTGISPDEYDINVTFYPTE